MGQVIALEGARSPAESLKPLMDLVAGDMEGINRIILDKAVSELSQMAQRLREADKAFEEAKQKFESDIALHEMNYEALKTRAELTHKLLEDTRNGMLERAKEIQSSIAA